MKLVIFFLGLYSSLFSQGFVFNYNEKASNCASSTKNGELVYIMGQSFFGPYNKLYIGDIILGINNQGKIVNQKGYTPDSNDFISMFFGKNTPNNEFFLWGHNNGFQYTYLSLFDKNFNLMDTRKFDVNDDFQESTFGATAIYSSNQYRYFTGTNVIPKLDLKLGVGASLVKYDWSKGSVAFIKHFGDTVSQDVAIGMDIINNRIYYFFTRVYEVRRFRPPNTNAIELNLLILDTLGNQIAKKVHKEVPFLGLYNARFFTNGNNEFVFAGGVVDTTFYHLFNGDSVRFTRCCIMALDSNMKLKWISKTGRSNQATDFNKFIKSQNGDYICVGKTSDRQGIPDYTVIDTIKQLGIVCRFDKNGKKIWEKEYSVVRPSRVNSCELTTVEEFDNGNILAAGTTHVNDGLDTIFNKIWILLLNKDGEVISSSTHDFQEKSTIQFYPNPSKEMISWDLDRKMNRIMIYDMQGKKVKDAFLNNNSYKIDALPKGNYIITLLNEGTNAIFYGKITKE